MEKKDRSNRQLLKVLEQILLAGAQPRLVRRSLVLHVLVRVEVRRVQRILELGNPRRGDLLLQQLLRGDDAEPRVVAYVHVGAGQAPEAVVILGHFYP